MKQDKQPMALFLASDWPAKVIKADSSRGEADWLRRANDKANAAMRAVEVLFPDGRRITVKPDFNSDRVRAAVTRLANRKRRDVDVYVEGDFRYRISPTVATVRSGSSFLPGGSRVPS